MTCFDCDSERILEVSAKCSDLCFLHYCGLEKDGYVPDDIGIGGGDYVEFHLCMNCGRVQNAYPINDELIKMRLSGEEDE